MIKNNLMPDFLGKMRNETVFTCLFFNESDILLQKQMPNSLVYKKFSVLQIISSLYLQQEMVVIENYCYQRNNFD